MNDQLSNQADAQADQPPGQQPDTLGPTLRHLREAKQITPAEACRRLKFSKSQLEALETEQWERLPKGMSLRGFVKNYARYLDADVDAMLSMLDSQVEQPQPSFVSNNPAAMSNGADLAVQEDLPRRPWGWLFIILVVVVVAAFYAINRGWVPDSWLVFDWLKSFKS